MTAGSGGQPAPPEMPGAPGAPGEPQRRDRPAKPRWWAFPRTRRYLARFSLAGLTGALACYWTAAQTAELGRLVAS